MNAPALVTLTTDFGSGSSYVAAMKGAILSVNVQASIVDLTHDLPPQDLVAISVEIPADIPMTTLDVKDLPRGWRKYPAPDALADLGKRWADEGKTAILAVPSAVVPQEKNDLLNPAHPSFRDITPGKPDPLSLDSRMWKG